MLHNPERKLPFPNSKQAKEALIYPVPDYISCDNSLIFNDTAREEVE